LARLEGFEPPNPQKLAGCKTTQNQEAMTAGVSLVHGASFPRGSMRVHITLETTWKQKRCCLGFGGSGKPRRRNSLTNLVENMTQQASIPPAVASKQQQGCHAPARDSFVAETVNHDAE